MCEVRIRIPTSVDDEEKNTATHIKHLRERPLQLEGRLSDVDEWFNILNY